MRMSDEKQEVVLANEETIQTNCINERDFMSKRLKHKGVLVNNNNTNENKRKFISILQYCPHLGEANKPKTASLMKLSSTNKNKNKVYKLQPITNNNTNNNIILIFFYSYN